MKYPDKTFRIKTGVFAKDFLYPKTIKRLLEKKLLKSGGSLVNDKV